MVDWALEWACYGPQCPELLLALWVFAVSHFGHWFGRFVLKLLCTQCIKLEGHILLESHVKHWAFHL